MQDGARILLQQYSKSCKLDTSHDVVVNSSLSFLRHGNGLADAVAFAKGDAIAVAWTVDGSLYLSICEAQPGRKSKKFALAAREQAALNFLGGAADACDSQEISLAGILLDGRQKVKRCFPLFEKVATKRRFGALAGGLGEARRRLEPRRRPGGKVTT